ncbi:uncharacterized protein [Eurosta solidaginis]|uniref:uncharacterized protein n=1 Tax=Eurosta solidaginis TaxID=178769 RepID=UPI00353146A8
MSYIYLSIILLLSLLTGQIAGQSSSTPTAATPQYCNESSSMAIDVNQISGIWYVLATNPAPKGNYLCAQVNLTVVPNNGLNISLTYSNTPTYPWVNYTMYSNTVVQANNSAGLNVSLTMNGNSYPSTTYKVLDTNYVSFTLICGYTNISDVSTYFATVLTRDRYVNSTILTGYETMAQANYSLFSNKSMTTISQTASCSANDGVLTIQMVSFLMVLMYAVIALFC